MNKVIKRTTEETSISQLWGRRISQDQLTIQSQVLIATQLISIIWRLLLLLYMSINNYRHRKLYIFYMLTAMVSAIAYASVSDPTVSIFSFWKIVSCRKLFRLVKSYNIYEKASGKVVFDGGSSDTCDKGKDRQGQQTKYIYLCPWRINVKIYRLWWIIIIQPHKLSNKKLCDCWYNLQNR